MNNDAQDRPMTAQEEYDFYADPDAQIPQGPPVRRRAKLSDPVPVRLPPDVLEEVKKRARDDDRSVSSWVRRAIEHELDRSA